MGSQQSHPQNIHYYSEEDYKNSIDLHMEYLTEEASGHKLIYQCKMCLRYVDFMGINSNLYMAIVCKSSECLDKYNKTLRGQ